MIRIRITEAKLHKGIEASSKGWLKKKAKSWSDVKPAYLALQANLCAYCEGGRDYIRSEVSAADQLPKEKDGEFAVEHFRPKGKTDAWPDPFSLQRLTDSKIDPKLVLAGRAKGYDNLRFAPWNYVVSCYTCNSTLKANRFPIAGIAATKLGKWARADIESLNTGEQPLLLYPLGDLDEDPEKVIQWQGVMPRPRPGLDARRKLRVQSTIIFFRLDGVGRPALLEARYRALSAFVLALSQGWNTKLTLEASPFRGCLRAFEKLHKRSPKVAMDFVKAANDESNKILERIGKLSKAAAKGNLKPAPKGSKTNKAKTAKAKNAKKAPQRKKRGGS